MLMVQQEIRYYYLTYKSYHPKNECIFIDDTHMILSPFCILLLNILLFNFTHNPTPTRALTLTTPPLTLALTLTASSSSGYDVVPSILAQL